MSDSSTPEPTTKLELRTLAYIVYGLFALGVLTAGMFCIATIAAVVLIYIKRADAAGTYYAAHFDWLLRTFWWMILGLAISLALVFIYIGWLVLIATIVWVLYRLIKGLLALLEGTAPMPYAD